MSCYHLTNTFCVSVPTVRPTAPVNVIATVLSATSVNLSWDRPMNDGGTPLTNYIITYHSNAEDHMIVNTNNVQLTRQLDDLAPFTAYQLQVSAENIVGISPASVTVNVMTLVGGTYITVFAFNVKII